MHVCMYVYIYGGYPRCGHYGIGAPACRNGRHGADRGVTEQQQLGLHSRGPHHRTDLMRYMAGPTETSRFLLEGSFHGDMDRDMDVEVDADIDRYLGCFLEVSKLVQVLLNGIEAIMLLCG